MIELSRAGTIAVQVRRFWLLSYRPDVLYCAPAERAEAVMDPEAEPVSHLDALLLGGADETDCVCAHAVVKLREYEGEEAARIAATLLDLISPLDGDRLIATYHAVRESDCPAAGFERLVSDHPVWSHFLEQAPQGIEDHLTDLAALDEATARGIADTDEFHEAMADHADDPGYGEAVAEANRFQRELLRRNLGLPHDLGPTGAYLADVGRLALGDAG